MQRSQVVVSTPEVLWHGGGNENGKADPVYSVDFHPDDNVLCTSGIDASVPPKGSVRIWLVSTSDTDAQTFLTDLCDHQSAVNVARFSPDGRMLATASERQIVVYVVPDPSLWRTIAELAQLERIWLRPTLNEVCDMQWSPDSTHLVIGAIDSKAEIIRVSNRDSLVLPGHSSYIQGVAWDPLGEYVVTQSADRSCKVHKIKAKPGSTVKLANRGHVVIKMQQGFNVPDNAKAALTAADFGVQDTDAPAAIAAAAETEKGAAVQNTNLFADSYVPSFFRRICWSPDGAFVIAPTGIFRPPKSASSTGLGNSYCTHIFARANISSPCVSLAGLEDASVAVRCFSRPYRLVQHASASADGTPASMIPGAYRLVFAVVTLGSVFVYDTQHAHPIAKFSGLHYAAINDAAWSADGRILTVCSSDGYLSFFRFEEGALGELLPEDEVPIEIKRAQPCMFHYTPPPPQVTEIPSTGTAEDADAPAADAAKSGPSTPDHATEPVVQAVVATAAAPVEADFAAETKKRKRIQPLVIATLGNEKAVPSSSSSGSSSGSSHPAVAVTAVASAVDASTASDTALSVETDAASAALPKAAKKRIAPQLVQPEGQ